MAGSLLGSQIRVTIFLFMAGFSLPLTQISDQEKLTRSLTGSLEKGRGARPF